MFDVLQGMPKEARVLMRSCFYAGNASALGTLAQYPPEFTDDGKVVIDAKAAKAMHDELERFAVERGIRPGRLPAKPSG